MAPRKERHLAVPGVLGRFPHEDAAARPSDAPRGPAPPPDPASAASSAARPLPLPPHVARTDNGLLEAMQALREEVQSLRADMQALQTEVRLLQHQASAGFAEWRL